MRQNKILYSINVEDVLSISEDLEIPFKEKDIEFLQKKIGDFMGDKWYEAIEYAFNELNGIREQNAIN